MVNYGQRLSTITTSLSETFSYSHSIHGSVGYGFNVEYAETVFRVETKFNTKNKWNSNT